MIGYFEITCLGSITVFVLDELVVKISCFWKLIIIWQVNNSKVFLLIIPFANFSCKKSQVFAAGFCFFFYFNLLKKANFRFPFSTCFLVMHSFFSCLSVQIPWIPRSLWNNSEWGLLIRTFNPRTLILILNCYITDTGARVCMGNNNWTHTTWYQLV